MASTTSSVKKRRKHPKSVFIGPGGPWHKSVPRRLSEAYHAEHEQGWTAWRKHLAKRRNRPLADLLPAKNSWLLWALPDNFEGAATLDLVELLWKVERGKARRKLDNLKDRVTCWLHDAETAPATVAFALECLAWCGALPQLSAFVTERVWWSLWNRLAVIANEQTSSVEDPLVMQLLGGELPLALAYAFPELSACRELVAKSRATISEGMAELLDGEGLPRCRHLPVFRSLLASWTRSRAMGQELSTAWCNKESADQYSGVVQHALRLSRPSGQPVFSSPQSQDWNADLIAAAVKFADDRTTSALFRRLVIGEPGLKGLPAPAFEGEWAGIAVLRSDWSRSTPQLTVAYAQRRMEMELNLGRNCLWSGVWEPEVRFNNQLLETRGNWEQLCWLSDDDVDYLELEMQLSQEVTVQRHVLLAREDRFLFMADAVLGIQEGHIEYRGILPIQGFSSFACEADTREGGLVVGGKTRARVLPLGLPEWRASPAPGSVKAVERGLELTQAADGQCLFAPLFVDLDRRRLGKELTWRQLTVAQTRQIVPQEMAVGYRAQVGKSQWLAYRSLAPTDVRTVLGKNLATEFLVGSLNADGKVKTIVEIE